MDTGMEMDGTLKSHIALKDFSYQNNIIDTFFHTIDYLVILAEGPKLSSQ